jgi:preprotein translocase subunit SecG
MFTILAILHIFVCVFLILVVLLQTGKGSDIGAVFGGGGSQALFGSAGPATFLGKLTTVVAAIFMFTSLALAARIFEHQAASALVEEKGPKAVQEAPAEAPPPSAAPAEKGTEENNP